MNRKSSEKIHKEIHDAWNDGYGAGFKMGYGAFTEKETPRQKWLRLEREEHCLDLTEEELTVKHNIPHDELKRKLVEARKNYNAGNHNSTVGDMLNYLEEKEKTNDQ